MRTSNIGLREARGVAQHLDELVERRVLVGIGIQGGLAHAPHSSTKSGSPDRSVRITSVLTRVPTSCSVSRRCRLAIGVPTAMSLLPL